MISRATVEAIRERVDIVELVSQTVKLTRAGSSLKGLCPFHQEKSPSFHVLPAKGIYHCFGCGEGGDAFKFVQKTRGLSFMEAIQELGQKVGVEIEERSLSPDEARRVRQRADMHEVCELACQHYHSTLMTRPEARVARDYLSSRGMKPETIERYRLGYAPDVWDGLLNRLFKEGVEADQVVGAGLARRRDKGSGAYDLFRGRLMVPIQDPRGRVVAFGGRVLPGAPSEAPKYVNSPETEIYKKSSVLYALPHARTEVQRLGRMLVVEGYFDVLSLHQAGFRETVATCGTALTEEHVKLIRPLTETVVALFDADEAGMRAAVRSLDVFLRAGIEPRRLQLPEGIKDPDEFVQQRGAEAFGRLVEESEPLFELLLRRSRERHGSTPGGLRACLGELVPILRLFPGDARAPLYTRVASALWMSEAEVAERVGQQSEPVAQSAAPPPRWTGTQEQRHLLWLLLHHFEAVAPLVGQIEDPSLVADRPGFLQSLALILSGEPLPSILDRVEDDDVRALLRKAAATEGLYDAERALLAASQILDRLRLNRIRGDLARVDRELDACRGSGDMSRLRDLLTRRQDLQKQRDAHQRALGGPGR